MNYTLEYNEQVETISIYYNDNELVHFNRITNIILKNKHTKIFIDQIGLNNLIEKKDKDFFFSFSYWWTDSEMISLTEEITNYIIRTNNILKILA